MDKQPIGIFDIREGLDRDTEIAVVNAIRMQAGGEPLTEEEIAAEEALLAQEFQEENLGE